MAPRLSTEARELSLKLWLLLALFSGRSLAQLLVAYAGVSWLPPMHYWYSGVIAYPKLLAIQGIIIIVFSALCLQFSRGHGYCIRRLPKIGRALIWLSATYFLIMVARLIMFIVLQVKGHWLPGGLIPIFFHWVLALYLFLLGRFYAGKD